MPTQTVGRITSRAAFAELQRSRARGACGPVTAAFVPADEGGPGVFPQVGYAIGRRCGGAVERNSLRRRARAVVRSEAHRLPRGSYVVRLGPEAAELAPADFRAAVAGALARAGRMAVSR
ncbi:MAG TPA: ribonuclease P protein component [Acidimicrobiales bacterium]|nr:ribonuclease P protein component [Acidimicrobiales bacterium]